MAQHNWGDSQTDQQFIRAFTRFINEIKNIEAPLLAKPQPSSDYWAFLTMLMIMERQAKYLHLDDDEIQAFASYMLTIAASMLMEHGFSNLAVLQALQLDPEDLLQIRQLVNKHRG